MAIIIVSAALPHPGEVPSPAISAWAGVTLRDTSANLRRPNLLRPRYWNGRSSSRARPAPSTQRHDRSPNRPDTHPVRVTCPVLPLIAKLAITVPSGTAMEKLIASSVPWPTLTTFQVWLPFHSRKASAIFCTSAGVR